MSISSTRDLIHWHMKHAATAAQEGWRLELFADRRHNFMQLKANDDGQFADDGQAWLHILISSEPHHLAALAMLKTHCEPELLNVLTYAATCRQTMATSRLDNAKPSVCAAA